VPESLRSSGTYNDRKRGDGVIHTLEFATETSAYDHITERAATAGYSLQHGVGNDMSTPFYIREDSHHYIWHPNGINGAIFRIGFVKRLGVTVAGKGDENNV
jgi:hypothetical protein